MNFKEITKQLSANAREYGMYIALGAIVLTFFILSNGVFLATKNMEDLMNQTGYIAVLAIGMTLVIVIRQIDLSVGFLAGFVGAVAATALGSWGLPVWFAIPIALGVAMLSGLFTGVLVAKVGIPSFVASLAGWLIYRGALQMVTGKTGTIVVENEFFNALGTGFIPDFSFTAAFLPHVHKLTWVLGLLAIGFIIYFDWRKRASRRKYGFEVQSGALWALKVLVVAGLLMFFTFIMSGAINFAPANYDNSGVRIMPRANGLPWTFVIMLVIMLIYSFVTQNTRLGRHIYAVGGNPEAAQLSGISVSKITLTVFGSMGLLTGIAGILFAARSKSAAPTAGALFELDAIAAAYIGGVSAAGGVGKVSSSIIGALVYMSLVNGLTLLGTDDSLKYIIRGVVLLLAVTFDVVTRKARK